MTVEGINFMLAQMQFPRKKKRNILLAALLVVGLLAGLRGFHMAVISISPTNATHKDFTQEYLMVLALRAGVAPYLPQPELGERFGHPTGPGSLFPHSTPHTPPLALLCFPLAFVSYQNAATIWLAVEMICLMAAIFLLLRAGKGRAPSALTLGLAFLIALGLPPVYKGIATGQINTILLLLLTAAWLALSSKREVSGGLLLGLATGLKLIFWPLWVLLAMQIRAKALTVAFATFLTLNLAAVAVMGKEQMITYYKTVGPQIAALYRGDPDNLSLLSVGWKLFEGTESRVLVAGSRPPLIDAPWAARWIGLSILLCGVGAVTWIARSVPFNTGWGMVTIICLLLSPITWAHYLTLLLLPVGIWLGQTQRANDERQQQSNAKRM